MMKESPPDMYVVLLEAGQAMFVADVVAPELVVLLTVPDNVLVGMELPLVLILVVPVDVLVVEDVVISLAPQTPFDTAAPSVDLR